MTWEPLETFPLLPCPVCAAFPANTESKNIKIKGCWKYLNKPICEDLYGTMASTFMLFRLTSMRVGSFAFILCKLASTLVGLGGSSKMGFTFSPLTTSAKEDRIKCWHQDQARWVSLTRQLLLRTAVLRKRVAWTTELRGRSISSVSLPCPWHFPAPEAHHWGHSSHRAGRYHHGQLPSLGMYN